MSSSIRSIVWLFDGAINVEPRSSLVRASDDLFLTKFRSSKEDDPSKIGKFGIGFMSVFAPRPELVVVDTSLDGDDWRILFNKNRSYELLLHRPCCESSKLPSSTSLAVTPSFLTLALAAKSFARYFVALPTRWSYQAKPRPRGSRGE